MSLFGSAPSVSYNAPSFFSDPNYGVAQGSLVPFASSLMSGQGLPSAYSGLITPNSPEFQKMLASVTGQTLGASQAAMASQGLGGSGVAASAAAGAVGSETANLSYQDFMNSQANQLSLMGMGSNIMQNVGSMALTNQGQNNQFNLTNASSAMDASEFNANMKEQQNQMWGSMISSGIGALGNIAGMGMLGMGGLGGSTGSTLGSSGVPSVNQWAAFMK